MDNKTDIGHPHSASDVTDNSAYTNIGSSANSTQKAINNSINTKLGLKADSSDVYTKSETYTRTEIMSEIVNQISNITLFTVVTELPTTNIKPNKFYLVNNNKNKTENVYDIYVYGEFCKTSTCSAPSVLLIPQEACMSCTKRRWYVGEDCEDNKTESYDAINETFNPRDEVDSYNYFCGNSLIVTGVSVSIVGTYTHDFSNYVSVRDFVIDSDGNISSYRLIVNENNTDEEFKYQVIYGIKNVNTNEDCNPLTARCRIKLKNVCNNCSEFMEKYCTITGNKTNNDIMYSTQTCEEARWVRDERASVYLYVQTGLCNNAYDIYMRLFDKDGNEITTLDTQFVGPNNNPLKTTSSSTYSYIQGRGWGPSGRFDYFIYGYYDGTPGYPSQGGHLADCSYQYEARVYNAQTDEYCDSQRFTVTSRRGEVCEETYCTRPTCDRSIPTNIGISIKNGVPTVMDGNLERVLFPSTGATIIAYEFNNTFYNGSTTYSNLDWCSGYVLSVETSSQHVNVHPSFVDDGEPHTAISITVDRTENEDGMGLAAEINLKLTTPNGTVVCNGLPMYLYQKGTNEN